MEDLKLKMKELQQCSLFRFKDLTNESYNLTILYFSPDDFHQYVGFSCFMDPTTKKQKILCNIGYFYVDNQKEKLFIDLPDQVTEITNADYQVIFKQTKTLERWNNSRLPNFYRKLINFNIG